MAHSHFKYLHGSYVFILILNLNERRWEWAAACLLVWLPLKLYDPETIVIVDCLSAQDFAKKRLWVLLQWTDSRTEIHAFIFVRAGSLMSVGASSGPLPLFPLKSKRLLSGPNADFPAIRAKAYEGNMALRWNYFAPWLQFSCMSADPPRSAGLLSFLRASVQLSAY